MKASNLTIITAVILGGIISASAQVIPETPKADAWVTDGNVYDLVQSGDRVYIGGIFSRVGPYTGAGVPLNTETGEPAGTYPRVNGIIHSVISDGAGGWYIGGEFTEAGGLPRERFAHIQADGSVSPLEANVSEAVWSLALSPGGDTLYIGGAFTNIGGETRNRIAALDTGTGNVTAWNPNADNNVSTLVVSADGNTVYAGGLFTTIGGMTRNHIAALAAGSGLAKSWNPNANGAVYALLPTTNNIIYAGGSFAHIGGQARDRIAALDISNGNATAWNPQANNTILTLEISPDNNTVYAGGVFTTIGGQPRTYIGALDAGSDNATAWAPDPGSYVYDLAVSPDGNTVYAGGWMFGTIGGQPRNYLAALDAATGDATAWNPRPNEIVFTMAISDTGDSLYIGGAFSLIGGESRRGLAAMDTATGTLLDWNPNTPCFAEVWRLAVSGNGNTLYVGGSFTNIGGLSRINLAALDTTTATVTDWSPNPNQNVYALLLADNDDIIYTGGNFTSVAGEPRDRLAAFDTATGDLMGWSPGANGMVWNLTASPDGGTIYAGGSFSTIDGQARQRIAAVDAVTGNLAGWAPNANEAVYTLKTSSDGNTVYAGGDFITISGEPRNRIASLDTVTGDVTTWNPNANNWVYTLALSPDESNLYAGGNFTTIGGAGRNRIAGLDIATGNATEWDADIVNGAILALAFNEAGNTLYVGGGFTMIGGSQRRGFAMFSPQYTLTYTAGANGTISGPATQNVHYDCDGDAVTAVPDTGYHFTQWSDNSTANPRQDMNITGDISVTANFALTIIPPLAPGDVTASDGDYLHEVRLNWESAAQATSYEIYRGVNPDGSDAAKIGASTNTAYTDTDVTGRINYYYRIKAVNSAGKSAFSDPALGFPGIPGPMLMANGMVGDHITLGVGETLTLSVRLHKHNYPAVLVDWWAAAYAHNYGLWYYLDNNLNWMPFDGILSNCRPAAIMPLANLVPHPIGTWPGLPRGVYKAWFAVDYPGDGILHLTPGYNLISQVTIIVN